MNVTVIKFQDFGQDFLEWTINEKGDIIDCTPFQYGVWSRYRVINKSELKPDTHVKIMDAKQNVITIKYPIVRVTEKEVKRIRREKVLA